MEQSQAYILQVTNMNIIIISTNKRPGQMDEL